jgi:O-antigen/teichoic acid export membrane protein
MTRQSASKLYAINASSSVLTRLVQIAALVWVNQYLIKNIPAEEYVLYPVILSLMIAGELFSKVFTSGVARFIVEKDTMNDQVGLTQIASSMLPFLSLAALVITAIGGLAIWKIEWLIKVEAAYVWDARLMLSMLIFTLVTAVISTPFSVGLYARQKFIALNILDLITETLRVGLMLGLLFIVSPKVIWLVVSSTIAISANLAWRIFITRREIPALTFRLSHVSKSTALEILRFGGWTSTTGVTKVVERTGPFTLLSHFGSALDIVMFNLGNLVDITVKKILQSATLPLQPALTRKYAQEGMRKLYSLYYRGGRYHLWILLFLAPPLIAFRHEMVTLYVGEKYLQAGDIMLFFLLSYPFTYSGAMFYRIANASGRVGEYHSVEILSTMTFLAAMLVATIALDLGGLGIAAAAFCNAVVTNMLFFWPRGLKMVEGKFSDFFTQVLWPGCLPCLLATFSCMALSSLLTPKSWLVLGLYACISAIVYCATLYFITMNQDDKKITHNIVNKAKDKLRAQLLTRRD